MFLNSGSFQYIFPGKVRFGLDEIKALPEEIKRLGGENCLLVTDKIIAGQAFFGRIDQLLTCAGIPYKVFDAVEPEPSIETVEKLGAFARDMKSDIVVGLGGGSVLDVAKGASFLGAGECSVYDHLGLNNVPDKVLPKIMIPTTSGTGSEVTCACVYSQYMDNGTAAKNFVKDPKLYAEVALVDPLLSMTMPPKTTAATGMDALIHGIEAYTNLAGNPITEMFAVKSIDLIGRYLRRSVLNGKDVEARYHMALGSLFAGQAFAGCTTLVIHALSQALGGEFKIPHGLGNAVMAVPVMRKNHPACQEKYSNIASLLGKDTSGLSLGQAAALAADAVEELIKDINIPQKLSDLSVKLDRDKAKVLVEDAFNLIPFLFANNPRQFTVEEAVEIVMDAI